MTSERATMAGAAGRAVARAALAAVRARRSRPIRQDVRHGRTADGRTVELRKAYSAIRAAPRTFVGFYADLSMLDAERSYTFQLELPALKPGQLQGVFFENVETEYTDVVVPTR